MTYADGRYGALDIGTVTCRLLVADVEDGRIIDVDKEYAITDLGVGVDATGRLSEAAIERVLACVDRYLEVLARYDTPEHPVRRLIAMATSASRDAANGPEFAARLAERGVTLAVIPGSREAQLTFLGASSDFPGENLLVVDIGGGTTDIAVLSLNGIATSSSIKVAGDQFNEAVVKYMRRKHNLLIGERTAEEMKMSIGCVFPPEEEMTMEIKGRCLLTGLPKLITVTSTEMMDAFEEPVERIMEAVANYFYIPVEQMISKDRSKDVAYPRQMAMYMIRQELEYSFPDIAKIFKRDHTTVMHACNKIEEERKKSRQTEDVIKKLHNNIRGD